METIVNYDDTRIILTLSVARSHRWRFSSPVEWRIGVTKVTVQLRRIPLGAVMRTQHLTRSEINKGMYI